MCLPPSSLSSVDTTDYHLACTLRGLRQQSLVYEFRAGPVHDLPGKGGVWGWDLPDASTRPYIDRLPEDVRGGEG